MKICPFPIIIRGESRHVSHRIWAGRSTQAVTCWLAAGIDTFDWGEGLSACASWKAKATAAGRGGSQLERGSPVVIASAEKSSVSAKQRQHSNCPHDRPSI